MSDFPKISATGIGDSVTPEQAIRLVADRYGGRITQTHANSVWIALGSPDTCHEDPVDRDDAQYLAAALSFYFTDDGPHPDLSK